VRCVRCVRRHATAGLAALATLAAGVAVGVLPALAPGDAAAPTTASFTARDFAWEVTGSTVHTVTLAAGGTVSFGYPSGASSHNADFSGGAAPTSCTQTAGPDSGAVPPLPAVPTTAGWSGTCRFDTPGTYAFHCHLHPLSMQGTIYVVDPSGPPPPPTTTTTQTATTTAPGQTYPQPGGSTPPSGGGSVGRLRVTVAHRQRGVVVHGVVTTPGGRSRVAVTAFASNRALARQPPRDVHQVRVGSRRIRSSVTGSASFAVTLNAAAQDALDRRGRLAVELRIVVTPPSGRRVTKTIDVSLRERTPPTPGYAY
jgi:plastocyanin